MRSFKWDDVLWDNVLRIILNNMKKILILTICLFLIAGCQKEKDNKEVGADFQIEIINKEKPELIAIDNWNKNKPDTDVKWAEDVKVENFDIKSNGKLIEMENSLNTKLPRIKKELDEMNNFTDWHKYQMRERFKDQKLTEEQITIEVDKLYADDLSNKEWDYNKIVQSVERINKELELREKGYLIVANDKLLGSNIDESRIRYIND